VPTAAEPLRRAAHAARRAALDNAGDRTTLGGCSTALLIPQFPQQYALDLVRVYSSGIADRVSPVFQDIEAEADAASEAYFDSRMNQVASEDESWVDEEAVAEYAQEHGFSVYTDLEFVRRQVTGLAIAGLYHLWERLVKEFLETSFRAVDLRWTPIVRQPEPCFKV
jgi:hypothetical protein